MAFIDGGKIAELRNRLSSDEKELKRIYRSKVSPYHKQTVVHDLVDELLSEGWEEDGNRLKYKTKLKKLKSHDKFFEDQMWCQMYNLGFHTLNTDENFHLPFGKNHGETQQIDVIAISDETIIIIECKSKSKRGKLASLKNDSEGLSQKIDGFRKSLNELLGEKRKLKFIYATRNVRLDREGIDAKRLENSGAYIYTDSTFEYVNGLIKSYKGAANYQFHAMLFSGTSISTDKIEVPAIEGKMGGETYYMFSIEPDTLLKLAYVLHRTRANEAELPTYQRLLVPSRLKGIGNFINDGGYFPNSLIVNFNQKNKKLVFQPSSKSKSSNSRHGILKIPNAYAIAYIIDGQHRLYGYSQSQFKSSNTIPVVAFIDLEPDVQLKLFMDINENQKAVSPTLRITLEEDLFWNAERLDSRMKALRSSVIRMLSSKESSPLYNILSVGEDKSDLTSQPFARGLSKSELIPKATRTKFADGACNCSLYDSNDVDSSRQMGRARQRLYDLISSTYDLLIERLTEDLCNDFVLSNRGSFPIVGLLGSLNAHLSDKGVVSPTTKSGERFDAIRPFIEALVKKLKTLNQAEKEEMLGKLGQGAETLWLRKFQSYVNAEIPEYNPDELEDWKERQDQELQDEARKLGTEIERYIKLTIIAQLKVLFGNNWELEIASIKRECDRRVSEQLEEDYKKGLPKRDIEWTEQFFITDYKKIIEKYWTKTSEKEDFISFQETFAINLGIGDFNSKAEKLKWLSMFNTWRNSWAHEGTKEKGLNQSEVKMVKKIHTHLVSD